MYALYQGFGPGPNTIKAAGNAISANVIERQVTATITVPSLENKLKVQNRRNMLLNIVDMAELSVAFPTSSTAIRVRALRN